MYHAAAALLLFGLLAGSAMPYEEIMGCVDQGLLRQADQIEIIRVNGKFSHIEYKKNRPDILPSASPPLGGHSLSDFSLIPFGPCILEGKTLRKTGSGHCGFILELSGKNEFLNLLSYDTLSITGHFAGSWKVAIADLSHYLVNDNVPVGKFTNSTGATFDLASLASTVDLKQARYLVFILGSRSGSFSLSNVSFARTPKSPPPASNGIWIWDIRRISGREAAVVDEVRALGVRRVYLQVGDDPGILLPFVKQAALKGIQVFALDGSPAYVRDPEPLRKRVGAVLDYNRRNPRFPFAGFQIDVEPYLNKDFSINREYYSSGYLDLLREIKGLCKEDLQLSAVIPFWYDDIPGTGGNLAFQVIDIADETVIMSYRSESAAILETARNELSYGEKKGKRIFLGLEINPIADEQHTALHRTAQGSSGSLELGGLWWGKSSEYQVVGSRLSFYGRPNDARAIIGSVPQFKSFAGWVIHSYEGLAK